MQDPSNPDSDLHPLISRDEGETWEISRLPHPMRLYQSDLAVTPCGQVLAFVRIEMAPAPPDNHRFLAFSSDDQGRTWAEGVFATEPLNSGSTLRGLDMAPSGEAAACWGDFPVHCSTSADFGLTWTSPEPVHLPMGTFTAVYDRVLVTDGSATLVIRDRDGVTRVLAFHSTPGVPGWSAATNLTADATAAMQPLIAKGAGTRVYVLTTSELAGQYERRLHRSLDGGRTWLPAPELLPRPGGELLGVAQLKADASGEVLLVGQTRFAAGDDPVHFVRRNAAHGEPGAWEPFGFPAAGLPSAYRPRAVQSGAAVLDIVFEGSDQGEMWVDRSFDHGQSWLATPTRLDELLPSGEVDSDGPSAVRSASGLLHANWRDRGVLGESPNGARGVSVGIGSSVPRLDLEVLPAPPEPPEYRFSVIPESIAWCSAPEYAWFEDDVLLPGETGSGVTVPPDSPGGLHDYRVEVSCPEPSPCGDSSLPWMLCLERDSPEPEPTGAPTMTVSAAGAGLDLGWTHDDPATGGYNIYGGSLAVLWGSGYDHEGLLCHQLRADPEDPVGTASLDPALVDSYFLVVPATRSAEGSAGRDSLGAPRPLAVPGGECGPLP